MQHVPVCERVPEYAAGGAEGLMPFQTVGRSATLEISFKASIPGPCWTEETEAFVASSLIFGSSARPKKSPARFIASALVHISLHHVPAFMRLLLISEPRPVGVNDPAV